MLEILGVEKTTKGYSATGGVFELARWVRGVWAFGAVGR